MTKIKRLSASQITRFAHEHGGCQSLWWWDKVAGIKEPPSDPMLRGIVGHSIFEYYFEHNKMPSLELVTKWCNSEENANLNTSPAFILRACTCALHRLPEANTVDPSQVERGYVLQSPELALPVIGFFDLDFPNEKRILDYKFRSSLRYSRTPEQLRKDVAANLYALAYNFILDSPDGPRSRDFRGSMSHIVQPTFNHTVRFEHLTIEMAGQNNTQITGYDFTPADLRDFYYDFLVPVVAEMKQAGLTEEPKGISTNPDSCYKYGRTCFYYSNCAAAGKFETVTNPVSMFAGFTSSEETPKMPSLLSKLLKTAEEMKNQPPPEPEPEPEPEPVEIPELPKFKPNPEAGGALTKVIDEAKSLQDKTQLGEPEERDAVRAVVKTGETTIQAPTVVQDNELTPKGEEIIDSAMHDLEDNVLVTVIAGPDFDNAMAVREAVSSLFDSPNRLTLEINEGAHERVHEALAGLCAQNKVEMLMFEDPENTSINYGEGTSRHLVVVFPNGFEDLSIDELCEHWDMTDIEADEDTGELPEIVESTSKKPRLPSGEALYTLKVSELKDHLKTFMDMLTEPESDYVMCHGPMAVTNSPDRNTLMNTLELVLSLVYAEDNKYLELNLAEPPTHLNPRHVEEFRAVELSLEEQLQAAKAELAEKAERIASLELSARELDKQLADALQQINGARPEQPRKSMLLIGSVPLKGLENKFTHARELLEPFCKEAAFQSGLNHYLLIDYGKGPMIAAAKLEAAIHSGAVTLPQILVYDYFDDAFKFALPVLRKHYDIVIGAVRG